MAPQRNEVAVTDRFSILMDEAPHALRNAYEHLIIGAGCAGLSLAWQLCQAGVEGPLALVDRRSSYLNDRTWCFWDVETTPFDHLATHRWSSWQVIDHEGRVARCSSSRYRYLRIRAIDFYRYVITRLRNDPRVDFYSGQSIESIRGEDGRVAVACGDGELRGRWAFQSVRPPPAQNAAKPPRATMPLQHFLGQTVITPRPVFDTECPILMDFRVDQRGGPHFMYVLPLSPDMALVESTYLLPGPLPAEAYRAEIAAYLAEHFGATVYDVIEEETGHIPMSTSTAACSRRSRTIPIGLAGGAARPSSGYAFVRIQRQARSLAKVFASGSVAEHHHPELPRLASRKYDLLDKVFLRHLADYPADTASVFSRLFRYVSPDSLVRFLCDQSCVTDDIQLIAALPKRSFISSAFRSIMA